MRITSFVVAAAVVALGTVTLAQSVTYDFDRSTDFSRLRTYAWVRGTRLDDELNHQRVLRAVDAQLALKGLAKVAARPDLLVAYHATFDRDLQINGFSSGFGPYRFGGSVTGSARGEAVQALPADEVRPPVMNLTPLASGIRRTRIPLSVLAGYFLVAGCCFADSTLTAVATLVFPSSRYRTETGAPAAIAPSRCVDAFSSNDISSWLPPLRVITSVLPSIDFTTPRVAWVAVA
jgi:hypothetical protein